MSVPLEINRTTTRQPYLVGCGAAVAVFGVLGVVGLVLDWWDLGMTGLVIASPLGVMVALGGLNAVRAGLKPGSSRTFVVAADGVSWIVNGDLQWKLRWSELNGVRFEEVYTAYRKDSQSIPEPEYRLRLTPSHEVEIEFSEEETARIEQEVQRHTRLAVEVKPTVHGEFEADLPDTPPIRIHPREWSRAWYLQLCGIALAVGVLPAVLLVVTFKNQFSGALLLAVLTSLSSPLWMRLWSPSSRGRPADRTVLSVSPLGVKWRQFDKLSFGLWWTELAELRPTASQWIELVPADADFAARHPELESLLVDGAYLLPVRFTPTAVEELHVVVRALRPDKLGSSGKY